MKQMVETMQQICKQFTAWLLVIVYLKINKENNLRLVTANYNSAKQKSIPFSGYWLLHSTIIVCPVFA